MCLSRVQVETVNAEMKNYVGGLSGLISGMVPGLDIDLSKVITFASFIRHEGNIKKHNMNMRKIDHLFL